MSKQPKQSIVHLDLVYHATDRVSVALPPGIVWEEVSAWDVRWDELRLTLRDGRQLDIPFETSPEVPADNFKVPAQVQVYNATNTLLAVSATLTPTRIPQVD